MSRWVHITGIVRGDTFAQTSAEAMYIGQTTINHLPRVHGSEGDAKLHVRLEDGYNCWSSHDEYNQPSNLYTDNTSEWFACQSNVLITISGQLRDATFDEALRETVDMLCRMARSISVNNCVVMVQERFGKSFVITDKGSGWLGSLYEGFWAKED